MNTPAQSKHKRAERRRSAGVSVKGDELQTAAGLEGQARRAGPGDAGEAAPAAGSLAGITAAERHQMISEAAYFRAERRAFAAGGEVEDWVEAEAEIDELILSGGSHARRAGQFV